ncbi:MAG: sodium:solute symporter, partial [Bacteroidetes bacterium]|nr:sodium:solute symporter [Bacteroidota bacterium]
METIGAIDFAVIGAYFLIIFSIAAYVTKKERSSNSAQGYFLGGRDLGWFAIGASLFASNIGSEHLIGLSGSGARGAFPEAQFEILASLILLLLGWVFVPFYLKSGVFTMPEFLERRYSTGARVYLSVVSIISYVLTKISFTIFAGALVFEVLLGIPFWTGALITVLATGLYTVLGGLKAVIYTDMAQAVIFILGGILATYFGLQAIGGWSNVTLAIQENAPNPDTFMSLWRNKEYPWTGVLLGAPILGIWYWCTDQFIVQRVLSAKDISTARKGTIFGSFLKLLPLFIFIFPGIIAYALSVTTYPDLFTVTNPITGEVRTTTDAALPALILRVLPVGVRGLVVAGFLAALMSSLSSVFNSTSTLFTFDFYKRWRPEASEKQLVMVGRLATVVLVIVGLAWIPFMRQLTEGGGIYRYLQSVQAYVSPPIAAAFLLGIFYKKINAKGALSALWVGFILGMSRLVLEYLTQESGLALNPDGMLNTLVTMNFLHYAIFLFVVSVSVMVVVSLVNAKSAPPVEEALVYQYTK